LPKVARAVPLSRPITAVSSCNNLLDQLIHAREQRRWNFEAEHPRSFEIDEKLELGRLFDRNVGGVGTFQDLVSDLGGAAEHLLRARAACGKPKPRRLSLRFRR